MSPSTISLGRNPDPQREPDPRPSQPDVSTPKPSSPSLPVAARALRVGAAIGLCPGFVLACTPGADQDEVGTEATGTGETETPIVPASLQWLLTWELGDASPVGAGWRIQNELGQTIDLEWAWVSSYVASLTLCGSARVGPKPRFAIQVGLRGASISNLSHRPSHQPSHQSSHQSSPRSFGSNFALAPVVLEGHPGNDDPSAVLLDHAEDVLALAEVGPDNGGEAWFFPLAADLYCGGHYLLAPAGVGTAQVDPELVGSTLLFRGQWWPADTDPDTVEGTAFSIQSDQAYGSLQLLDLGAAQPEDLDGADVEVRIVRDLSRSFEGIDLQTLTGDPDSVGFDVLRNLATTARFEFTIL